MDVTVTLPAAGADELRSLYGHLTGEFELRGRVRLVEPPPSAGTLGGVPEALIVALGQGGAGAVLAGAAVAWLRMRTVDVVCKFRRADGSVAEVSAKRLRGCDVAAVQEIVRELSASLEADEAESRQTP